MTGASEYPDGYYWVRLEDGTTYVALREDGHWFVCGVHRAISSLRGEVIRPIPRPLDA